MTKKERDIILDGECINAFDTRGPLLNVEYKKSGSHTGVHKGSIWFDIESAAGLSLAPQMHKELENPEITRWIKENLKGKPFEIISHIKLALPRELRGEYEEVLVLISELIPTRRNAFIEFVKSLSKANNDKKLENLVKKTISVVATGASSQKVGSQNLSKLQKLLTLMEEFCRKLLDNSGFEISIIIPVIGSRPDDRVHKVSGNSPDPQIPSGGIVSIVDVGLWDTQSRKAIKLATVLVS